jgi:hypothetical protein
MKVRESGMPSEQTWETFLDAHRVLTQFDFNEAAGSQRTYKPGCMA